MITVGAVNHKGTGARSDDVMASYSSRGPTVLDRVVKPDLVAPGNMIVATQAFGELSPSADFLSKNKLSGTSMAAPVVSGAVALLLQQSPAMTPDQVKARLMKTAYKVFPAAMTATDPTTGRSYPMQPDIFTIGAGMVDIQAALASTDLAAKSARSPAVRYNSTTKKVELVGDTSIVWGEGTNYGLNVVWGSGFVSGTNVVWGANVVWGSSTVSGFSIVWGETSPWASSTGATSVESLAVAINGDR